MPLSSKRSDDHKTTYHQYTNGRIGGTLILGDCIHKMRCMPGRSIGLLATDPPYLVNYLSRDGRSIANDKDGSWLQPVFDEVYRLLKPNSFAISLLFTLLVESIFILFMTSRQLCRYFGQYRGLAHLNRARS